MAIASHTGSMTPAARFAGWSLVGWTTAGLGLIAAVIAATHGVGEEAIRALIRATARTSLLLFTMAFVASSLHGLRRRSRSRWLLANRRYVGVSFAASHGLHLLGIFALARIAANPVFNPANLIGGGGAYVFIALMVATSFDRTAAWLGPRAWRRLHRIGMYWIWTIFFVSYLPRALTMPGYWPAVMVLATGMALRVLRWRSQRPSRAAAA